MNWIRPACVLVASVAAATGFAGQSPGGAAWQPFDWVSAHIGTSTIERAALIVTATLEGVPGDAFLQIDLGATQTVLHGGALTDRGATFSTSGDHAVVSGVIGGLRISGQRVGMLAGFRATITKGRPLPVIGTLGLDFFQRRVLVLDLADRRLAMFTEGAKLPSSIADAVTFVPTEQRNGKLYVPITIDGVPHAGFFLDTGASGFAMVTQKDTWRQLTGRRDDDPRNTRLTVSSWDEDIVMVGAPMRGTLGLGPASTPNPIIWFADDSSVSLANWPNTAGLVGNELFARRMLVIDLPGGRIGIGPAR